MKDDDHTRALFDAEERRTLRLIMEESHEPLPEAYKKQKCERRMIDRGQEK